MKITAKTKLCMVIGDPIEHSLSPQIHNTGYQALGINNEFVYLACQVNIAKLAQFIGGVRAMGIRGVSCTIPHKIEIMPYLDEIDPIAKAIGAVNTVVNDNGVLKGYNTDWQGIIVPLEKITTLRNKKVALLGAGGAARAAAYALNKSGAQVIVYNRTLAKAQVLAKKFGCEARAIKDIAKIKNSDIIVNATSVGLSPEVHATPLDKELITSRHIVFDTVYTPYNTKLLQDAEQRGAKVIHGMEMLLEQAVAQFALYTGKPAPVEQMRNVLLQQLLSNDK